MSDCTNCDGLGWMRANPEDIIGNTCRFCEGTGVAGREREVLRLYNELIMAVGNKYEDETRHQTALRYIQQAEQNCYGPEAASVVPPSNQQNGAKE